MTPRRAQVLYVLAVLAVMAAVGYGIATSSKPPSAGPGRLGEA